MTTAEAGAANRTRPRSIWRSNGFGRAARALHVGDEDEDEQGAAAAGVRFAPAPLATAFAGWS